MVDNGCHGELDILCLNGIKREMDFDAKDGEGMNWGSDEDDSISVSPPLPPTLPPRQVLDTQARHIVLASTERNGGKIIMFSILNIFVNFTLDCT